ncbi:hypothetical protein [Flavobacterium sp. K5-23]|uniref:hypothetical protein n=1 Tax=Flavobacterium sp. K5-23 TaxID=2746225 RepID=UPI00200E1054|nr:hypothetical protein [Flavobacterium sp. K5-23]UQD56774.1 hypothetical protein FLAK523_10380 [Flavobacterium sp. K5-23]
MKKYYGIIFTVIYALIFRVLVEFDILEINSWTYIIIIPVLMGYLPFVLDKKPFLESKLKFVLFPMISVIAFLLIAFLTRLEDLGCFIILLPPYLLISIIVSFILRSFLKNKTNYNSNSITKNSLLFIAIPLFIGNIEKLVEKKETNFEISEKIVIDRSKEQIWNNLFSVPDLTNYVENSTYNYFGFPNPIKSEYNIKTNTRLGYFSNGIILNESVFELKKLEKLSFKINVDKSDLKQSQTFKHILKNKNLVFNSITYKLKTIDEDKTELTLICDYKIKTNIPLYGEYWSKNIITDFEKKLLNALKKRNEQ